MDRSIFSQTLQPGEKLPDDFVTIPPLIYADDPFWPGEDTEDLRRQFISLNPWFGEGKAWIGYVPGQARLAGFISPSLREKRRVYFGFWETLNAPKPNQQLFTALGQWARAEGAIQLVGPINFTTLGKYRLRTDIPYCKPFRGEPYNPAWYQLLLEQLGFEQCASYKSVFDEAPLIADFAQRMLINNRHLSIAGITLTPLTAALWKKHQKQLYQAVTREFRFNNGWATPSEALFNYYFNERTIEPFCHTENSCIAFGPEKDIAGFLFCQPWPEQQTCLLKTLMISRAYRRTRLYPLLLDRFSKEASNEYARLGAALLNSRGPTHSSAMRACDSPRRKIHHYALYQKDLSHEFL